MPCQFGDSPMSLDKKNYITGNQKRQALFLNFLNFFIYIYKIPSEGFYLYLQNTPPKSLLFDEEFEDGETSLV